MLVPSSQTSPTRQTPPERGQRSTSTQAQTAQKPEQVQSRPLPTHRSMSQPALSLSIPPPGPAKGATSSADLGDEPESEDSPVVEICGSPSWSDFGGSKKKKEKKRLERERKELEKKLKKVEKEKQAAAKAGKRLSKRPPAAMETQRMPTALRPSTSPQANSTATSPDNSRASSRRNSLAFQTPTSETASATDATAPAKSKPPSSPQSHEAIVRANVSQVPKLSYMHTEHSRNGSISTQDSTFAECDEQYVKNLVSFASQLDTSATNAEPQHVDLGKTRRVSFSAETTRPAPPSRSITMANVKDASRTATLIWTVEQPEIETRTRRPSNSSVSSASFRGKQDGREGGYQYPSFTRPRPNEITEKQAGMASVASSSAQLRSDLSRKGRMDSPGEGRVSLDTFRLPQLVQSGDGGSYVQKHRMHQQQRSIAGFEDELALSGASELTIGWDLVDIKKQRWPPTPSDSSESLDQPEREESTQRGSEDVPRDIPVEGEDQDQYHAFLATQSRESTTFDRQPSPSSPKKEKLLEFRRRPKLVSPSTSTTSTNTITQKSTAAGSPFPTLSPPLPVSPGTVALVSKISKAERIFGEAVPEPPSPPLKSANRISRQTAAKWGIEPVQNYSEPPTSSVGSEDQSKSRTISSQNCIVNSVTSKARPNLPKFSTTPDLSQKPEESFALPSVRAKEDGRRDSSRGSPSTSTTSSVERMVTAEARTSEPVPQVVVEGIDGDGATRKTSIIRPRSNPQLQDTAVSQDLSFLPELKHQALVKPNRKSPTSSLGSSRSSYGGNPSSDKSSSHSPPQFPAPTPPSTRPSSDDGISLPVGASSLNFTPKAGFRSPSYAGPGSLLRPGAGPRRSTMSPASSVTGAGSAAAAAHQIKPLAKMFVICCKCKYWHDLPSRLYEAMAMPRRIVDEDRVVESAGASTVESNKDSEGGSEDAKRKSRVQGNVETRVQCPWCEHGMSTGCCGMFYLLCLRSQALPCSCIF